MSTPTQAVPSAKQQLLETLEQEHAITMRVLRAYPGDKLDLRPHAKSKTAVELAGLFAWEPLFAVQGLTTGLDWSAPPAETAELRSMEVILESIEEGHGRLMQVLRDLPEERLYETLPFPVAPGTIADISKLQFIWALVSDQIHHRGQFSVYLRLADAKVPSIYGPTADEPW